MAELSISPDEIRSALSEFAQAYEPGAAQKTEVGYVVDARKKIVLAMCATDNLARGASAQALQAFNVSMGWPDALGLPEIAQFP